MNIHQGDLVQLLKTITDATQQGSTEKGKVVKVLRVMPDEDMVLLEGVGRVMRHLKPNRRNAQGGRLLKERAIHVSNVALYCSTCRKGVRVNHKYLADGTKTRICNKCKNQLGVLSKARKAYAGK